MNQGLKQRLISIWEDPKNKILIVGFIFLGIVMFFLSGSKTNPDTQTQNESLSADTVIPKGFVLVPVEIQNIDSLSSLVGSFAIVDLFTTSQVQQKGGVRVGRRIRLLRAPLNPQAFAVLVPENEAHEILGAQGPFTAVIQNPETPEPTQIDRQPKVAVSRIEYLKGPEHGK